MCYRSATSRAPGSIAAAGSLLHSPKSAFATRSTAFALRNVGPGENFLVMRSRERG